MPKTLTVSDETYEKIKNQILEEEKIDINVYEDMVGKAWFFRTVTHHCVGKVVKIIGSFLQLETASWIADDGRFSQAIKEGKFNEIEPVGTMFLNINTVIDFFPAKYKLPTEQK